jgi:hypothetical protein
MKTKLPLVAAWCLVSFAATAQVPQLLNSRGGVGVNGKNFDRAGQFEFALANSPLNHLSLPTLFKR